MPVMCIVDTQMHSYSPNIMYVLARTKIAELSTMDKQQ